ncbi:MAG: ADP-ribosylglycohydrolase family protein [Pseudomarimonas sp.]
MAELPPLAGGVSGNTAAEKAGNNALRSDALNDRATAPKATIGSTDKVLSNKALQQDKTAAKPTCTLTREQFRDKAMGMMLMGAFGDALGAAHEVLGLNGEIAKDLLALDLRAYKIYEQRTAPEAFGVWPTPLGTTLANEVGIVTDDTGVRVMMLHQWLRDQDAADALVATIGGIVTKPDEKGYEAWLQAMHNHPYRTAPAHYKAVFAMRERVINEVLYWLSQERSSRGLPASPTTTETPANRPLATNITQFWDAVSPVVFGQFLYLELASIYFGCERAKVLNQFKNFSILDHGYAGFSTGMLAAILAQAIRSDATEPFATFFIRQAEQLLDATAPAKLIDAWQLGKQVGTDDRGNPLQTLLEAIRDRIFVTFKPFEGQGRGKFDCALFLAQMSAVLHWAGSSYEALCALAFGVGDSDTIPAQLGSIMGAYYGETAWRDVGMATRFDQVQAGVEKYFATSPTPAELTVIPLVSEAKPFRFGDVADCLARLASRHGCCEFR